MLVLVGPSGSGKSSLLRAGLAASLVEDGVGCDDRRHRAPSEDELLAEIEAGTERTVLVLDQVEEVVARLAVARASGPARRRARGLCQPPPGGAGDPGRPLRGPGRAARLPRPGRARAGAAGPAR